MTPSDTQVLYNLGVVYVQLGQRAQAQGVYSRLKQVDPRSQYVSMLERYLQ
jgi:Flp pilus assembly protein TadD